jgi:Leucine-rich repeat (LRR) protein
MSLDYSEKDLEKMPDEFFDLEELELVTELDMSRNQFHSLPPDLFKLQNLHTLDLSSNGLQVKYFVLNYY